LEGSMDEGDEKFIQNFSEKTEIEETAWKIQA
jgi:hypothetical protein